MRILFLASEVASGTGGIRAFNRHLIDVLVAEGHAVSVVSMNDTGSCGATRFALYPCARWRPVRKFAFVAQACLQALLFRPDAIVCGHVNFLPVCGFLGAAFRILYLTVIHGLELQKLGPWKTAWLKGSKKIMAVSSFTKTRLLRFCAGYAEASVVVVGNTFDVERFNPAPKPAYLMEKLKIQEDQKVVLTVARLAKGEGYKGYDKVLLAMRRVVKEFPGVRYVIAGSGSDMPRMRKLIQDYQLRDCAILAGFVADREIPDYYNLCDVFVMPSTGEGFGIVFLEALACGKPVIAGNLDGSREALVDGELGILVNPHDTEELSEVITKVLRKDVDPRFLDGNFLRQSAIRHFGIERFREKIRKILSSKDAPVSPSKKDAPGIQVCRGADKTG